MKLLLDADVHVDQETDADRVELANRVACSPCSTSSKLRRMRPGIDPDDARAKRAGDQGAMARGSEDPVPPSQCDHQSTAIRSLSGPRLWPSPGKSVSRKRSGTPAFAYASSKASACASRTRSGSRGRFRRPSGGADAAEAVGVRDRLGLVQALGVVRSSSSLPRGSQRGLPAEGERGVPQEQEVVAARDAQRRPSRGGDRGQRPAARRSRSSSCRRSRCAPDRPAASSAGSHDLRDAALRVQPG